MRERMKKVMITAGILAITALMVILFGGCAGSEGGSGSGQSAGAMTSAEIESALDLTNMDADWTYDKDADAWTFEPVTAVTNPEIDRKSVV